MVERQCLTKNKHNNIPLIIFHFCVQVPIRTLLGCHKTVEEVCMGLGSPRSKPEARNTSNLFWKFTKQKGWGSEAGNGSTQILHHQVSYHDGKVGSHCHGWSLQVCMELSARVIPPVGRDRWSTYPQLPRLSHVAGVHINNRVLLVYIYMDQACNYVRARR